MKKLFYTVLATLIMGTTFTGCTSKKDVDQLNKELEELKNDLENIDLDDADADGTATLSDAATSNATVIEAIGQMVKLFKETSIKTEADVQAFTEKLTALKEKYPDSVFEGDNSDMTPDEAGKLVSLSMELSTEAERLEKEAQAIGLSLDDIDIE